MNAKNAKAIEKGTAILMDLDNTIYTINPAARQKMAVLVPDWNIPQITKMDTIKKKIRSFLNLVVIAKMIKAAAVAAALHP